MNDRKQLHMAGQNGACRSASVERPCYRGVWGFLSHLTGFSTARNWLRNVDAIHVQAWRKVNIDKRNDQ